MRRPDVEFVSCPQFRRPVGLEQPAAARSCATRAFAVARDAVLAAATTIAAIASAGVLVGSGHGHDDSARRNAQPMVARAALRSDVARQMRPTVGALDASAVQRVLVPPVSSAHTRRGRFVTAQFADHDARGSGGQLVRVAVAGRGEPAIDEAVDVVLTMQSDLQLGDAVRVRVSAAEDRVSVAVAQRLGDAGLTDVVVVPGSGVLAPSGAAGLDLVRELCAREAAWHGLDARATRSYCSITRMAQRRDGPTARPDALVAWDGGSWLDPGR